MGTKKMNKKETAQMLAIIGTTFPQVMSGGATTVNVWTAILGDLPSEAVTTATLKLLATNKYEPKPAEIREATLSLIHEQQKPTDNVPTVDEAWEEVMKNLNQYEDHSWSHPLIKKAVKIIGYMNIVASENMGVERGHFFKVYESLRKRELDHINNIQALQMTKRLQGIVNLALENKSLKIKGGKKSEQDSFNGQISKGPGSESNPI